MINLFEKYTEKAFDLESSLIQAGYNNQTIVIEDDGFIPLHVQSPVGFFTGMNELNKEVPKFFNEILLPKHWEIMADNQKAEIFDGYKKKGNIVYSKRAGDYRIIKNIEWLNEQGIIRVIDMYNQYGKLFGKQTYSDGQLTLTSYFDGSMKEVILINHITNTVQVYYQNKKYYFGTFFEFMSFYFKLAHIKTSKIFYNSMGISYFLTLFLQKENTEKEYNHTLFWQEESKEIPANMEHLLRSEDSPTNHLVIQNHSEYIRLKEKIKETKISISYLGMLYQFKRQISPGKSIFILTNSDNIAKLDELAEALPEFNIKIAAQTEMSSKLLAYNDYSNISLYPTATVAEIKELISTSSFYFDINYGNEVENIIRTSFENNLLIIGFAQTKHDGRFISAQNTYEIDQVSEIVQKVNNLNDNIGIFFEAIGEQWRAAGQTTIDDYKEILK